MKYFIFILISFFSYETFSSEKRYTVELMMVEYEHGDGFNWGIDISNAKIGKVSGISFNPGTLSESTIDGSFLRGSQNKTQFELNLQALVSMNLATIVQNPRVSTSSGKPASINVTDKRYYEIQKASNNGLSIDLKLIEAPIKLEITPTTSEDGSSINLDVKGTLSEFLDGFDGAYAIEQNDINSTLNINDGETFIIGGMIKETNQKVRGGIPLLKDIPGLGLLFSRINDRIFYKELVIYITVYESVNSDKNKLFNAELIDKNEEDFYRWLEQRKKSRKDLRKKRKAIKQEFRNLN